MNVRAAGVDAILEDLRLGDALADVGAYINRQRWSGAQDTTVRDVILEDAAVLMERDPTLVFTVTRVTYADGRVRRYALPLGLRPVGDALAERAPAFMIATLADDDGGRLLYDALGDPAYLHWLWRAIREERTVTTQQASLRCERTGVPGVEEVDTPWVRVLTVEQSNTSVELGDSMFLKHMRRVEPGPSHELEMARALSTAGFPHIAPVLADVLYDAGDSAPTPLALVQPYLRNSADGWALALTSLRDLYADADEALATGRGDPAAVVQQQGGAFVGEAARLGQVIAEMHLALSRSGDPGMRTEPVTAVLLNGWADAMIADLDALLRSDSPLLEPLRTAQQEVRRSFEVLRDAKPGGLCTRIHGDLHLGQTLRVDSGWILLDFEGEPDRTPAERRALSSPLRDVAGMLRSFDYAAAVALTERVMPESADWEGLMAFGDAWAAANRRAFWSAYLETVGAAPLLPQLDAALVMRRAFETQKAVYEAGYELGHRPSWVGIPVRFLTRPSA
ncbi:MAG: hypothetical protein JOZ46_03870 [Candidatus Dormibacteraeota bacterium]|nr:hypothetical protein [Candidatus Dormibacteraeota bacterium]MBV9524938.1 hypothetical protein [Candidatus Dormibacteraeota bacterium]